MKEIILFLKLVGSGCPCFFMVGLVVGFSSA